MLTHHFKFLTLSNEQVLYINLSTLIMHVGVIKIC